VDGQEEHQESDGALIVHLYQELIQSWNSRNADDYAGLFAEDGNIVGFDGSQMNGRSEIAAEIGRIFEDHVTAPYYVKVREVRFLAPNVALLRAVAGMIPPGQTDINPAANSIQSLIAVKRFEAWEIALFQNTPAQFHGRPELVEQLTEELRQLL
jgi:uncharacterized protein (TIGR02246 family)